jgi:hypothetical protein
VLLEPGVGVGGDGDGQLPLASGVEPSGHVFGGVGGDGDGQLPLASGVEPSGHVFGGAGGGMLPPDAASEDVLPVPLLLPLLLFPDLPPLLSLDDVVVVIASELCFFFAKTLWDSSDVKTIVVSEQRRMKIVNIDISREFCMIFVVNILIVLYFYF